MDPKLRIRLEPVLKLNLILALDLGSSKTVMKASTTKIKTSIVNKGL